MAVQAMTKLAKSAARERQVYDMEDGKGQIRIVYKVALAGIAMYDQAALDGKPDAGAVTETSRLLLWAFSDLLAVLPNRRIGWR